MTSEIVVVHFYALRDPESFDRAARLLVARLRLHGHPGLRSFRFLDAGPKKRRVVAVFEGPEAWVGHHALIEAWPETQALHAAARVARTDLYGQLSPPVLDWVLKTSPGQRLFLDGQQIAPANAEPERQRPRPIWPRGSVWRQAG